MNFFNGRATHKKSLVEWRSHVQGFVGQWIGTHFGMWEPVADPVELRADFHLPKAASNRTLLPASVRSGDLDKYLRGLGDAISLGEHRIIADDSQIVNIRGSKRWCHGLPGEDGYEPGVRLKVRRI